MNGTKSIGDVRSRLPTSCLLPTIRPFIVVFSFNSHLLTFFFYFSLFRLDVDGMKAVIELDSKINGFVNLPWGQQIAFSPIGTVMAGECLLAVAKLQDQKVYIQEYGMLHAFFKK